MIVRRMLAVLGGMAAFAAGASAQSVESFYQGKSLTMLIATSPGGDYDLRARLLARHYGKFIMGHPTFVPRNMPGGGGITATNWMFNVAPKDGTHTMLAIQTIPTRQAIGNASMKFDVRQFGWIGNTSDSQNVVSVWHGIGVKTIEDARRTEIVMAATGYDSGSYYYPAALNMFAGTKFKIVTGYPGGNEMSMAMERGEAGGRGSNSWDGWKSTKPDWIAEKKLVHLVQVGLKRHAELADVPLMHELGLTEDGRAVLRFLSADTALARALVTTPGVQLERLAELRRAFEAMVNDADFLAEANKLKLDISILPGEEAQKLAASIIETPPHVLAQARQVMER